MVDFLLRMIEVAPASMFAALPMPCRRRAPSAVVSHRALVQPCRRVNTATATAQVRLRRPAAGGTIDCANGTPETDDVQPASRRTTAAHRCTSVSPIFDGNHVSG